VLTQVFGGDRNRAKRITDLQHTVATLEAAKAASSAEYDRIRTRNKSEIEKFKKDKANDFMNMLVRGLSACFHKRVLRKNGPAFQFSGACISESRVRNLSFRLVLPEFRPHMLSGPSTCGVVLRRSLVCRLRSPIASPLGFKTPSLPA